MTTNSCARHNVLTESIAEVIDHTSQAAWR